MIPSTICAGFKKSGVFSFNPEAIDCSISIENTKVALAHSHTKGTDKDPNLVSGGEMQVFSAEQQQCFQTRYEEGYDIPDPEYLQWLAIHHPESVSADQHGQVPPTDPSKMESLTDLFSLVDPLHPLTVLCPGSAGTEAKPNSDTPDSATESAHKSQLESSSSGAESMTSLTSGPPLTCDCKSPSVAAGLVVRTPEPSPSSSGKELTALCASVPSSSLTPCSRIPGSSPDDELKYISNYLVQFVPAPTPKTKDSAAKRVSGARVL